MLADDRTNPALMTMGKMPLPPQALVEFYPCCLGVTLGSVDREVVLLLAALSRLLDPFSTAIFGTSDIAGSGTFSNS
jgi:hypothetical protein